MGLPRYAYDLREELVKYLQTGRIKKKGYLVNGAFKFFFQNRTGLLNISHFFVWSFRVSEINYSQDYAKHYFNSTEASFDLLFNRCFKRLYEYDSYRGKEKMNSDDSFKKYKVNWFVAWYRDEKGNLKKETVKGFTSKWFLKKANQINKDRSEREKNAFMDREVFQRYSTRIYPSRVFPPKLRELIFKRDNYTCQNCGKNKENCIEKSLRLEAHHIQAYQDGGDTCYTNGLTLCSECNIGIHHAKPFKDLPKRL